MNKLILLVTILLFESVLTGLIPHSRGYVFDLLEMKTGPIWVAISIYFLNYFILDFFCAIKRYFVLSVALVYRTKETSDVVENITNPVTNMPQRVQEDIKLSYQKRIEVWCEYFVSATIIVQLVILNYDAPLLIIAALIYAALSVLIAILFNPRLNKAEKMVQEGEAAYRTSLVENIKDLSLLGRANFASKRALRIQTEYQLFTRLQLGVMSVLPYVVLVPALFASEITLGTLVKHQASFALLVVNASILIQYYTVLIQGIASKERVDEMKK